MCPNFDKYDEPRLHWERLMKARLTEFDLSLRILIFLESGNIRTLGDLCSKTKKDLRSIPQIGVTSVGKIEDFLARNGLSLSK